MLASDLSVPAQYLRLLAERAGAMGVDVKPWLARGGLSEAQLRDASLEVALPTLRQLIVDAMALTDEPALGLLVGERLLVNAHGVLGFAAMNSGSIGQLIELLERYISVRFSLVSLSHESSARQLRVLVKEAMPLGEIRRPVLEAVVLALKNVLDFVAMGACPVEWVAFPFAAPGYAELARDLFKCDVRYGRSWAGLALPLEAVDQTLKTADPAAFQDAARLCERELEKLGSNASVRARVGRLMLEWQNGFPSLPVTARLLHVTPRTLHRRLLVEGTSYRQILEEARRLLAAEHLRSGRLSVQEIAYTLGYTDTANFRRAFKRWEGLAPTEYRARQ